MKGKLKLMLLGVLTFVLALSLFGFVGCANSGNDSGGAIVNPPEKQCEVTAVTLSYNGGVINGVLSADLSMKTLDLSVRVDGDEGADKTVKFSVENEKIAYVDKKGKVILKRAGETMITATAGDVSSKFVLVVGAGDALSYPVTINGGRADKTTAAEGEYVKLTPEVPMGKRFVEWSFSAGVTWVNGSSFRMPATSVTVTAVYKDVLYTLNVIGATVKRAGPSMNPVGEYRGNTKNGSDPAYDIMKYEVAHAAEVVIEPLGIKGKAFVGFDKDVKNNRVGNVAEGEYTFNMDASDVTITGIYSAETKETMGSSGGRTPFNSTSKGFKYITKGKPAGEALDADLNEANGYRFAIPADTAASVDYPENITIGANGFDTMTGTKLAFVTFKNRHTSLPVTVEWYLSYQGCGTTTGRVTIGPSEVKKVVCSVSIGAQGAPWSGFCVRKSVGGSSSDTVLLDMTVSTAVQYPDGDKTLSVVGEPEVLDDANFAVGSNIRSYDAVSNGRILNYHDTHIVDKTYAYTSGFCGEITNLPKFDPENPTVTLYIKAINNAFMLTERGSGFNIVVSKNEDFSGEVDKRTFVMRTAGQIELYKFEITRASADEKVYISFAPFLVPEEENVSEWHSATFQYFYNDVIGYEE